MKVSSRSGHVQAFRVGFFFAASASGTSDRKRRSQPRWMPGVGLFERERFGPAHFSSPRAFAARLASIFSR